MLDLEINEKNFHRQKNQLIQKNSKRQFTSPRVLNLFEKQQELDTSKIEIKSEENKNGHTC